MGINGIGPVVKRKYFTIATLAVSKSGIERGLKGGMRFCSSLSKSYVASNSDCVICFDNSLRLAVILQNALFI